MPIVSGQQLEGFAEDMDNNLEACCVIYAMCAYTMLVALDTGGPGLLSCDHTIGPEPITILQAAVEMRKSRTYDGTAPTTAIIVSAFLCASYERLGFASFAWFYLREATTLVYTAGLCDEEYYIRNGLVRTSRERCLFWYLFIKERVYALKGHKPLSLSASIDLPTVDNVELDTQTLFTFAQLVNLYGQIDVDFFTAWNQPSAPISQQWLTQLQRQMQDAIPVTTNTIDSPMIDLLCSRAWIQTLIWQLALRRGLLSSHSGVETMTFNFPYDIGSKVTRAIAAFPIETLRCHGASLVRVWKALLNIALLTSS